MWRFKQIFPILFFLCLSGVAFGQKRLVMGALGDSISTAFNAERFGNNYALSWSTGDHPERIVLSHYHRLSDFIHRPIMTRNYAVPTSTTNLLPYQAAALSFESPDYVTLASGANDLCEWRGDYERRFLEMKKNLEISIESLIASNPKVKILMPPVPDMFRLWELMFEEPYCQVRWDLIQLCRPLLQKDLSDFERRSFVERWLRVNTLIAEVASKYPENVRHDPEIALHQFAKDHVSKYDCFHPNTLGQNILADLTWKQGWYQ